MKEALFLRIFFTHILVFIRVPALSYDIEPLETGTKQTEVDVSAHRKPYNHSSGGKNMNNGIDLVTPAGTAVYAVFDGVVSRVFTCPNGTKGIIIRHGDYMSVYANLGSVAVSEGSKVKTRQSIGTVYIASDGTSEFSFQLWNGQQSQNPRNWLR